MDWNAISAISSLVSAVAVVISLLYVAVQLRQNTRAIEANSRSGLLDGDIGLISDYMTYSIDPHLITDDVNLSAEDERRFTWIIVKALRIREFAWHQYRSGLVDEATWQSYLAPVPGIFSTKRAKAVLDFYTGDPAFLRQVRNKADLSA